MDELPPLYIGFGGFLMRAGSSHHEVEPPSDPMSIDMVLQGIARASDEQSCDHGVSLSDHCDLCKI